MKKETKRGSALVTPQTAPKVPAKQGRGRASGTHPQVHVTYCDDIRHELGSKHSIIGVYGGDLLIPSFPATIPKLCVLVSVTAPLQGMYKSLSIAIELDGKVLVETGELTDDVAAIHERFRAVDDPWGEPAAIFQAQFSLSPLSIARPGILSVHAVADGVELMAPALKIAALPTKR